MIPYFKFEFRFFPLRNPTWEICNVKEVLVSLSLRQTKLSNLVEGLELELLKLMLVRLKLLLVVLEFGKNALKIIKLKVLLEQVKKVLGEL